MSISAALFVLLISSDQVRVSFDLSTTDCPKDCGVQQLSGTGTAYDTTIGSLIFVEVETAHGATAILEIVYDAAEATIHYVESTNDELTFIGVVDEGEIDLFPAELAWPRKGSFSFRAVYGDEVRVVVNGVVEKLRAPNPDPHNPRPPHGNGGGGDVVVIVESSGGCGGEEPPPDDDGYTSGDTGCEGDTSGPDDPDDPDYSSSGGGCEGDTTDDGYSSGSGGCEGDSSTDTTSSSSGGCEGDSSDSSSSSSGSCEGDSTYYGKTRNQRAGNSMWRLAWPVLLAGTINRALKARGAKKTPPRSSP